MKDVDYKILLFTTLLIGTSLLFACLPEDLSSGRKGGIALGIILIAMFVTEELK